MGATSIEWTDRTWNPLTGCTKVSPGCDHCYAKTMHERFNGPGSFDTVTLHPERLRQPLSWRKPSMVFVNSMSDLFHQDVPDEFIAEVFAIMACNYEWDRPTHTFQVLTKRHARMRALLSDPAFRVRVARIAAARSENGDKVHDAIAFHHWPLPNVWLGVSVENQQWADIRIPALLDTPAAVRFLSCEPLLGSIDLCNCYPGGASPMTYEGPQRHCNLHGERGVDWVIVGGESGPGARPMHPDWPRSLRDQCVAAEVPFLFKQWGSWTANSLGLPRDRKPGAWATWSPDGITNPAAILDEPDWSLCSGWTGLHRRGKKAAGRLLDGRTWDAYPECAA